ncbi:fat storage-inducing transmembrane protein 2-like isoform X2 [Sinocyclocheilus rhinocerous]|uniref:fat storage-inducing transmembrane protein 2-like isoform X2 n=1 Tax=Sinocyclocheilus rhinocerous TaxID=307959 RepID=UPI0007B80E2A|nr:PREDICTED: fat storage-inducing transmembrane protein 2-like isoform X2 [Sinocyclocheilus rhinocerous]
MAAVGSLVNSLACLWRQQCARTCLPHLFVCISFTGSILKATGLVPESYFSNSRNVLNLSHTFVLRRLTSLLVATFIWYTCTETFFYIEDITGSCYESDTMQVIHGDITTKAACKKAGFIWDGFDISGHSFILTYSSLVIVEEMVPMLHIPQSDRNIRLDCLYIALNAIVAIWIWMFGCTSVYFHDIVDKVIGTLCGILVWYVTYVVWYPMPFSPGLPPQQKQHA